MKTSNLVEDRDRLEIAATFSYALDKLKISKYAAFSDKYENLIDPLDGWVSKAEHYHAPRTEEK